MASITCALSTLNVANLQAIHAFARETRQNVYSNYIDTNQPFSEAGNDAVATAIFSLKETCAFTVQVVVEGDLSTLSEKTAYLIPTLSSATSSDAPIILTGSPQQIPQPSDTQIAKGQMILNFPVTIQGPTTEVPWGISDYITFQLQVDQGPIIEVSSQCLLQMYVLADDLPEYSRTEGIPVQFLEMMVLPTIAKNIVTIQDWIEFVVWTCFASKHDKSLKDDPELQPRWQAAVHSYRYNSFVGGAANYAFDGGAVFDLDSWLANCTVADEKQWFGVNCYDMSALLQTALRLGLPYHYVDQNGNKDPKVLTVSKAYREPYGYINPVDLIGWGQTNSPFFEAKEKIMVGLNSPERQSFGNHAWVSVRLSNTDQNDLSAFDACAGPAATPNSMSEYLKKAIDVDATLNSTKYTDFNPNQVPNEYPGVQHIVIDQPLAFWQKTPFMGDSTLRLRYNNSLLCIGSSGKPTDGLLKVESIMTTNNIDPIPVPVSDLLNAGFFAAAKAVGAVCPSISPPIPLQAREMFTYGSFNILTPEMSVTSDGTIFRFSMWEVLEGPPMFNISVVVLTNFKMALEYLVGHLSMMNHAESATWDITEDQITSGKVDILALQSVPVAAAIRSNVLVIIDGMNEMAPINAIQSAMGDFMLDYFGKPLSTVSPESVRMLAPLPEDLPINDVTPLKFDVPGAVDFTLTSKTKTVRIVKEPTQMAPTTTPSDTLWEVLVSYVYVPVTTQPKETLVGAFAAPDTYYTTSKEFPAFESS